MWEGKTVALLAPGPSLNSQDVEAVRRARIPALAIGDAFRLAPWADMLYHTDSKWWRHHCDIALKFEGLKVTQDESCEFPQVLCVPSSGERGFETNPSRLRNGNNSGYAALHLLVQSGAARIICLGLDLGGTHFFGEHPAPLTNTPPETFTRWIRNFQELAIILEGIGVEIINCSQSSALRCFKTARLSEVLHDNRNTIQSF